MSTASERVALTQELALRLHDYWHDVDHNWGRGAHLFYTEDGRFEASSGALYAGRDMIAKYYQYRESRGARSALHLVSNFRAEAYGEDAAFATWYLQIFASDGVPPHELAPPIMIALMRDDYRKINGDWLCARRNFGAFFKGRTPVTRMPGAPEIET